MWDICSGGVVCPKEGCRRVGSVEDLQVFCKCENGKEVRKSLMKVVKGLTGVERMTFVWII